MSDTCDVGKESTEGALLASPELPCGLYGSSMKHTGTMMKRTRSIHTLNKELRRAEVKAKPRYDYLALLLVYTASRCVANALLVDPKIKNDVQRPERPHDFWARPIISGLGLYFFICPRTRFVPESRLHILSWRTMQCLAAFLCDVSIYHVLHLVVDVDENVYRSLGVE